MHDYKNPFNMHRTNVYDPKVNLFVIHRAHPPFSSWSLDQAMRELTLATERQGCYAWVSRVYMGPITSVPLLTASHSTRS